MTYRENLPMTMKSCFYPLIGDRIFGWIGDAIDIISGDYIQFEIFLLNEIKEYSNLLKI